MAKQTFSLNDAQFEFLTSPGVFAQYGLDVGSEILLHAIVEWYSSPSSQRNVNAATIIPERWNEVDSYPGSPAESTAEVLSEGIPNQVGNDEGGVGNDEGESRNDGGTVVRGADGDGIGRVNARPRRILDLGCGCGFIGLSLVGYFGADVTTSSRKDANATTIIPERWNEVDSYPGSPAESTAEVLSEGIPNQVGNDGGSPGNDSGVKQDDGTATTALLMDSDIRAVRLSRKNAKLNKLNTKVEVEIGDAATDVPKGQFDLVVSNPPTHQGREVVMDFIRAAHHGLREGGEAWFVVNRMASMIKKVDEVFGNSEKVGKKKGYIVVRAVKG